MESLSVGVSEQILKCDRMDVPRLIVVIALLLI